MTTRAPAAAYASSEKLAPRPRSALDGDLVAEGDELLDGPGRRGDACLTGAGLSGDTDLHAGLLRAEGCGHWFTNLGHDPRVAAALPGTSHK